MKHLKRLVTVFMMMLVLASVPSAAQAKTKIATNSFFNEDPTLRAVGIRLATPGAYTLTKTSLSIANSSSKCKEAYSIQVDIKKNGKWVNFYTKKVKASTKWIEIPGLKKNTKYEMRIRFTAKPKSGTAYTDYMKLSFTFGKTTFPSAGKLAK